MNWLRVCVMGVWVIATSTPARTDDSAHPSASPSASKAGQSLSSQKAELNPTHSVEAEDVLDQRSKTLCEWEKRAARRQPGDRKLLAAILARPEFAEARERPSEGLRRWINWLWEQIELFLQGRPMQSFASGTRTAVLVAALVVIGVAMFRLLKLIRRRRSPRKSSGVGVGAEPLILEAPSAHLARARLLLAQSPRLSIREGLLALLSTLEQARWARPERVKTNREVASELTERGAPVPITVEVHRLLRWYDGVFYSLAPVPGLEAERFLDDVGHVDRLRQDSVR